MTVYEQKLATFIELCDSARGKGADRVVVRSPQMLGDSYEEILASLNRLASAGLALVIIPAEENSMPQRFERQDASTRTS